MGPIIPNSVSFTRKVQSHKKERHIVAYKFANSVLSHFGEIIYPLIVFSKKGSLKNSTSPLPFICYVTPPRPIVTFFQMIV